MKITRKQLRSIISEFRSSPAQDDSSTFFNPDYQRRPELQAILDAAHAAVGKVPHEELRNFFGDLNRSYANDRKLFERRMETDVMRIVTRVISQDGPKTHQELLANVLDEFPNTTDEEIDMHIDSLEDSGDIIFDPSIQKYK